MKTLWRQTSRAVYMAIYEAHQPEFSVFSSYTKVGDEGDGVQRIETEWAFKDADAPIIRSACRGEDWSYYIAVNVNDEN